MQMLKLPDVTVKARVEGLQRARISALSDSGEQFAARAQDVDWPASHQPEQAVLGLTRISPLDRYIKFTYKTPPQVLPSLNSTHEPAR
ncbi:hypothetical protein CSC88_28905, partial [Klebsiella pneumoniae]